MKKGVYFSPGGTLKPNAKSYIEREADQLLFDRLRDGEFCYVLTSRQVGKSSLMVRVSDRLNDEHVTVAYLDLTQLGGRETQADQWYQELIRALGEELNLTEKLRATESERANLSPEQRWQSVIRDVILNEVPGKLVIIIDEIDNIKTRTFNTDSFFAHIRACYNARSRDPQFDRITFCLSGCILPTDLIQDRRSTPFNIGNRIDLTDFTEQQAMQFIAGLNCDEALGRRFLKRIHYWTNGHPQLTQKLCIRVNSLISTTPLFDDTDEPDPVLPDWRRNPEGAIDKLCKEFILTPEASDDNVRFVERKFTMQPENEHEIARVLDLYRRILAGQSIRDRVRPDIDRLKLIGLVKAEKGVLTVRNRIYAEFFNNSWIDSIVLDSIVQEKREAARRGFLQAAIPLALALVIVSAALTYAIREANIERIATIKARKQQIKAETAETSERQAESRALAGENRAKQAELRAARGESSAMVERGKALLMAQRYQAIAAQKAILASNLAATNYKLSDTNARLVGSKLRTDLTAYDVELSSLQMEWDRNGISQFDSLLANLQAKRAELGNPKFELNYWKNKRHEGKIEWVDGGSSRVIVPYGGNNKFLVSRGNELCLVSLSGTPLIDQRPIYEYNHGGDINAVAVGKDGIVYVGGPGGIDAIEPGSTHRSRHIAITPKLPESALNVRALDLSPDGSILAIACHSGIGYLIRTGRNAIIARLTKATTEPFTAIRFTSAGDKLLTGSDDGQVMLWDITKPGSPRPLAVPEISKDRGAITDVACSPDGKYLAAAYSTRKAYLWQTDSPQSVRTLLADDDRLTTVGFSHDSSKLLVAGRSVTLWSVVDGNLISTQRGHTGLITCGLYTNYDDHIVTISASPMEIGYWQNSAAEGAASPMPSAATEVYGGTMSADSRSVIYQNDNDEVVRYDLTSGRLQNSHQNIAGYINTAALSKKGDALLTSSFDPDRNMSKIQIWNVTNMRPRLILPAYNSIVNCAISSDGRRVAVQPASGDIDVYDALSGVRLRRHVFGNDRIFVSLEVSHSLAFMPNGRDIVCGSYNSAILYDYTRDVVKASLVSLGNVTAVAVAPDGQTAAVATDDRTIRIWDLNGGAVTHTFKMHLDTISSLQLTENRLISSSADQNTSVVDTRTWNNVFTLHTPRRVYQSAISRDGSHLITFGGPGQSNVW